MPLLGHGFVNKGERERHEAEVEFVICLECC